MDLLNVIFAGPYNTLYIGGLVAGFGLAWWEGRRRGWPLLPWLALLAACVAGGIVGSKLLHFDLHVAGPGEKTILGGITGGMLALLLAQRFLRFGGASCRVLGPAVLLGFALGRVGCFLVGCCFGQVTTLPWGVQYGPGTAPFQAQLTGGLLEAGAAASLPVHPTQLYEAVAALLLALAFRRWSERLRSAGAGALALAVGYGLVRFQVEFLRADGELLLLGLSAVQLTLGLAVIAAAAALAWRELRVSRAASLREWPALVPETGRTLAVIGVLLVLVVLGGGWLTPLERVALAASVLPALAVLLHRLVRELGARTAPGLAAAALLVPITPERVPDYPRSYFTVGGSMSRGAYEIISESCGYVTTYEHEYEVWGASGSYTHELSPRTTYSVRAQGFLGENRLLRVNGSTDQRQEMPIQGGAPSGTARRPLGGGWLDVTLGLTAGESVMWGDAGSGILPLVGLRAGHPAGGFVDLRINDHEPAPYPRAVVKLGGGYEFSPLGSQVHAGLSDAGFFVSGRYLAQQRTEIEPFLGIVPRGDWNLGIAVRQRIRSGAFRGER